MSGKTSGSDAKSRDHHDGSAGRAFTVEQKAAVIRIKSCAPTAYYKILGLEEVKTSCSDSDIKKAYRKLSLLTHPDKNGYDGADDAFKLVAKAFQVLSDPDKKKKYDQFGLDPMRGLILGVRRGRAVVEEARVHSVTGLREEGKGLGVRR
jgi:DnaJ family protein B protein 12